SDLSRTRGQGSRAHPRTFHNAGLPRFRNHHWKRPVIHGSPNPYIRPPMLLALAAGLALVAALPANAASPTPALSESARAQVATTIASAAASVAPPSEATAPHDSIATMLGAGVSRELAVWRAGHLSNVSYALHLDVTS